MQEVAERAVAAAKGTQALLDGGNQVEQIPEPVAANFRPGWSVSP